MLRRRAVCSLFFFCLAGLILSWMMLVPQASAATFDQQSTPTPAAIPAQTEQEPPLQLSIADDVCIGCHGTPGLTLPLENGEILDLYVNPEDHANSIHGQLGYACVQCHAQVGNYPHPPFQATDIRQASIKLYEVCQRCHIQEYRLALDSHHAFELQSGNPQAAICTDCHTAHSIRQLLDPQTRQTLPEARVWIPETCAKCHSLIYEKYKDSVHGSALIGEGNPDVPTCIDCHGVHNIADPTTNFFRLKSPQICAGCHTDPRIMGKYGISTDVLTTYVADFHGTTVAIFEKLSPDAETNKPVCYDCHGVHDIVRASDPQKGLSVRQNLLARCQVCHPDATTNFPDSWASHYIPSLDKNAAVYYVNLFYKFFIPTLLGSMGILVFLDFGRSLINSLIKTIPVKKKGKTKAIEAVEANPSVNVEATSDNDSEARND